MQRSKATRPAFTRTAAACVVALGAAVTAGVAAGAVASTAAEPRGAAAPVSRPYAVVGSCRQNPVVRAACDTAIRYLRALDLDRFETACAQLARGTLENAGGIEGCSRTLATARGIRIRYGIHAATETGLGTSVRFRTRSVGGTGPGIDQIMVLQPEGGGQRILIVMADPSAGSAADL